tara:strand:+ start:313 stop:549 length:237 start_codon:yes stop_codon:yes gene_type:complete
MTYTMKPLTIKHICETAGALQLTQTGNLEAMQYAKYTEDDALLVVNKLRLSEFQKREPFFIYPKGVVSYARSNKEEQE